MKNLFEHERDKYNVIHRYTGIHESQVGYGRQLNELLNKKSTFHDKWRSLLNSNNSFLEIGLGAGKIVKFFHSKKIEYCGIDISDYIVIELSKLGINVKQMSAHNIDFPDNTFDVVQHLDGLEHIPVEWELNVLSEELRVSKKYVFHSNAMGDASLDAIALSNGFDALHINVKTESEWDSFYELNSKLFGYTVTCKEIFNGTYYTILEKRI